MKHAAGVLFAVAVLFGAAVGTAERRTGDVPAASRLRGPEPAGAPALSARLLAAESTYWRGEYDSARVAWHGLLDEPAVSADSVLVAEILTWLGTAAWRLGDHVQARRYGEEALALKQRLKLAASLARSRNALGLLAWSEGRLTDALVHFRAGLESMSASDDPLLAGKLAANVGLIEVEFARFDAARAGFEAALRIAREHADARLEGNALTNLAMLDIRTDAPELAIPRLVAARRAYRSVRYVTGEETALRQLSTARAALGDLQRAFAALDSADVLAGRHDLKRERAAILELKGDLYRDGGDVQKAVQHFERAQALHHELGLEVERGAILRKVAEIHRSVGARAAVRTNALAAIEIHQATGARLEEFHDHLLLAEEAAEHLQRAGTIAVEIGTPTVRAQLALVRARVAARRHDHARVLALLAAEASAVTRAGFDAEAEAAALRAAALAQLGRRAEAIAAAGAAVDALERTRITIGSSLLKASFVSHRAALYGSLISTELRLNRPREAFRIAELARSWSRARLDYEKGGASAAGALRRVRELTATLNDIAEEIAGGATDRQPALQALNEELAKARLEYEGTVARADWQARATGAVGLASITAALRPGEALVQYLVAGEQVFAFLLDGRAVHARELPVTAAALIARIHVARTALMSLETNEQVLTALHETLLGPFRDELTNTTRLIVVPHGALSYLPFAALRDPHTGRYLVQELVVQYLPAASELPRLRGAEPVVRPGAVVFQPLPRQLPGTRAEARAVRRNWPGSRVLTARRASAAALRAALTRPQLVHVSTHGAMDGHAPLFSYLTLADARGREDRFEIHDVFATRVRSPLVFLSGCETGLGSASTRGHASAGDASTFAQAFLGAGARAVVATVWRIEDRSAAVVAERFYHELKSHDPADALARAQRSVLANGEYARPFYWAAYVLTGDLEFGRAAG